MKKLTVLLLLLPALAFSQSTIPDLVCQNIDQVTVIHSETLPAKYTEEDALYRITDSKLFLSGPYKDEYEYGELVPTDYLRFSSGYKTFIFMSDEFKSAVEIHSDSQGTRIRRLHCARTN